MTHRLVAHPTNVVLQLSVLPFGRRAERIPVRHLFLHIFFLLARRCLGRVGARGCVGALTLLVGVTHARLPPFVAERLEKRRLLSIGACRSQGAHNVELGAALIAFVPRTELAYFSFVFDV